MRQRVWLLTSALAVSCDDRPSDERAIWPDKTAKLRTPPSDVPLAEALERCVKNGEPRTALVRIGVFARRATYSTDAA
jgi:hypothetical protein